MVAEPPEDESPSPAEAWYEEFVASAPWTPEQIKAIEALDARIQSAYMEGENVGTEVHKAIGLEKLQVVEAHRDEALELLGLTTDQMESWFSSEYLEHPTTKRARAFLLAHRPKASSILAVTAKRLADAYIGYFYPRESLLPDQVPLKHQELADAVQAHRIALQQAEGR